MSAFISRLYPLMILFVFLSSMANFYLAILPPEADRAACVINGLIGITLFVLMARDYKAKRAENRLKELERGAQEAGANQTTFTS